MAEKTKKETTKKPVVKKETKKATKKPSKKEEVVSEEIEHIVTQEDIENKTVLATEFIVGDVIKYDKGDLKNAEFDDSNKLSELEENDLGFTPISEMDIVDETIINEVEEFENVEKVEKVVQHNLLGDSEEEKQISIYLENAVVGSARSIVASGSLSMDIDKLRVFVEETCNTCRYSNINKAMEFSIKCVNKVSPTLLMNNL